MIGNILNTPGVCPTCGRCPTCGQYHAQSFQAPYWGQLTTYSYQGPGVGVGNVGQVSQTQDAMQQSSAVARQAIGDNLYVASNSAVEEPGSLQGS